MLTDAERDELLAVMSPAQWLQLARAMAKVQAESGYGRVSVEFRRGLPRHIETVTSMEVKAPPSSSPPPAITTPLPVGARV